MADNQVDLKLNLDFQGVNDALYQMIGEFKGTDKEFLKITNNMQKNAKNFEAAVKLFGPASIEAGRYLKALQKDFVSLAANGVDPASQAFKKMTASMPTPSGLDAATGSLRKNNMQWTNLALVLQDLPFGFRGIQNNLPALVGGFAAATGPIYLGISAVIALITAWDLGMFKAKKTTDDLKQSQDDLNKALSNSKNDYYANQLLLTNYVKIARDANSTDDQRKNAINEVNKVLKDYGIKLDENTIKTAKSEEAINKVTEAMLNQALIAAYKDDYVALVKILDKEKELAGQAKKTAKASEGVAKDGLLTYQSLSKEIDVTSLATKAYTNEADRQWMNQEQVVLNAATAVEKVKSKILELQKVSVSGLLPGTGNGGKPKPETKPVISNAYENLAEEEFNFYKDSIFRAEEYFVKLNNIRKVNALMEATIKGASADELFAIQQTYEQKEINFRKSIEDKKFAIREQSDERQKQLTKANDDLKLKAEKELTDRSVYFSEQRIKAVQLEADASIKANRGNYQAQKQALEDAIVKLGVFRMAGIGGAEAMLKLDEAISNNRAKIEGLVNPLEQLNQTLNSTFSQLNIDLLTTFGEQLGQLISGKEFDFTALATILADALSSIGKALLAYAITNGAAAELFKNPGTWPAAIVAGIAAIAAGSALKSKLNSNKATAFANGGIVSGPTMGLVGEYPGAQNNPEVIAPLDKLKSMIGGGGSGTFVLRGQDLLLSVNRAQKASNLKGQNISLA